MKILFYRYGSICEEDILKCMLESGHEVQQITEEIYNKKVTFSQSAELVVNSLDARMADCVFTINFYPAISEVCNIYHIRYICWIVDSPVLELFSKPITNSWNRVFLFDRSQYEEIAPFNPKCIFHYPLAVDVSGKQKVIQSADAATVRKFSSDVSFVGSLYTEKSPYDSLQNPPEYLKGYLDGIIESQLNVYGYYFIKDLITEDIQKSFTECMPDFYRYPLESFLSDADTIAQYYIGNKITSLERPRLLELLSKQMKIDVYTGSNTKGMPSNLKNHGFVKTMTEMPIVFHESRINLNPTSKAIRSGVPLRVFDIMACEGFVLSNYQIEMAELFMPGEDFVYYESIEQVPELINYYLEHDGERREIAHNAFTKIRNEYSYLKRLNGLLLKAFSI